MPVVQNKRQLPVHEKYNFMALDEDGFDLPSDWYVTTSLLNEVPSPLTGRGAGTCEFAVSLLKVSEENV